MLQAGHRQNLFTTNNPMNADTDTDTDTPETDHALHGVWYRGDHGSAIPQLCRELERERNELRKQIESMKTALTSPAPPQGTDRTPPLSS
jgi:hypothetical protein